MVRKGAMACIRENAGDSPLSLSPIKRDEVRTTVKPSEPSDADLEMDLDHLAEYDDTEEEAQLNT